MIGHEERIIFCEGTCTRKHVVYELCARAGIEYKQLYTYHFIEKGVFLQYMFKQSALCLIACLISSQQRSANTAEQQVLLVQSTVVVGCPQRKNQGALNHSYVLLRQSEG